MDGAVSRALDVRFCQVPRASPAIAHQEANATALTDRSVRSESREANEHDAEREHQQRLRQREKSWHGAILREVPRPAPPEMLRYVASGDL